jgi:hypothetical protein
MFMRQTIAEISQQLKPLNRCLLRREVTTSHQLILTTQTFCLRLDLNKKMQACSVYQRIPNFLDK